NLLSIHVTDTGTGIPKEEQEHVFSAFYQTKQAVAQQGTGLGLPLVKELVKLYNGTILLQSEPGKGTSLTAVIPVSKDAFDGHVVVDDSDVLPVYFGHPWVDPDVNPAASQSQLLHYKDSILIIEDNTDLREFMARTLQNNNYLVLSAGDGE